MNRKCFNCLLPILIAGTLTAMAEENQHVLRFNAMISNPTGSVEEQGQFSEPVGDGTIFSFDGTARTEADSDFGFAVDYEYRYSDLLGFTAGVSTVSYDVEFHLGGDYWLIDEATGALLDSGSIDATETVGDVSATALTLGTVFHFGGGEKADFYAGPFLAWVMLGDLDVEGDSTSFDDDFTLGAVLGMDLSMGAGGWSFGASLRYLDSRADLQSAEGGGEFLALRPIELQAGATYRF